MKKHKTLHFTVIDFVSESKALDWPKNLPIPAKGDRVRFDEYYGIVTDVTFLISGNVSEHRIRVTEDI